MSILIDETTRVVVQGITGRDGSFHTTQMMDFGTNVVAGVTPGKGGSRFEDKVPIFDSVEEAVKETRANTSVIYVRAPFAPDAICEAAAAGVKVVVCITEGIPVKDMAKVLRFTRHAGCCLVGPNCPGVISPGKKVKVGILPASIHQGGPVGVVSRSGTLTYEVVFQLSRRQKVYSHFGSIRYKNSSRSYHRIFQFDNINIKNTFFQSIFRFILNTCFSLSHHKASSSR